MTQIAEATWLSGAQFGLADIIVLPLVDRMDDLSFSTRYRLVQSIQGTGIL